MGIIKNQDKYWMQQAIKEAKKAYENEEMPVGAVIVKDDRIIGRGYNCREGLKDPTAHAEIIAITSAATKIGDWRLNDSKIYVTLEPCPMCTGAILNARIDKLVFGTHDKDAGMCGSRSDLSDKNILNHSFTSKGGVMKEECKNLLNEFFEEIRE